MLQWNNCNIMETPKKDPNDNTDNTDAYNTKKHFIVTIQKKNKQEKFKWTLSKQKLEPYSQCWMTDSVCSFYSYLF